MAGGRVSVILCAAVVACLLARPDRPLAQGLVDLPVGGISLPNVIDRTVKVPTILLPKEGPPVVSLPPIALPTINLLETVNLPPDLGLPKGDPLLLVNLPGVSIVVPNLGSLAATATNVLGVVLDQVAPINQLFAAKTNINLISPLEQLINSLTVIDPDAPKSPGQISTSGTTPILPLAVPNLWMWNAVTFGAMSHGGFQYQASHDGTVTKGSTLPIRSSDRADLPGLIWDASKEVGLRKGTLHLGLIGGLSESDLDMEGDATLRSVGIADAGSAEITSWSIGGFALLATGSWYAGAAVGGSWGSTESENHVVGAAADFDVSGFTSALFIGTIIPLTDAMRIDLRGTAGYQRTVGDAHKDTLGITYGDHVIEGATGGVSARLFGVIREGGVTARPYVQAGVAHRFHYDNALAIADVDFTFSDADTSVFTAGGVDFEIDRIVQLSIGVRQDHSPDFDSLAGRVGVLIALD